MISFIFDNYMEEIVVSNSKENWYGFTQMREIFKFMCMEDMSDKIEKLLKYYPLEEYRNNFRVHGLYWASYYNRIDTILLFEDCEVDNEDMIVAVQNGHLEACKILADKALRKDDEDEWVEQDVGYFHRESNTIDFDLLLEYAVKFDEMKVAKWLVEEKGAKVSRRILMYAEELSNEKLLDYVVSKSPGSETSL